MALRAATEKEEKKKAVDKACRSVAPAYRRRTLVKMKNWFSGVVVYPTAMRDHVWPSGCFAFLSSSRQTYSPVSASVQRCVCRCHDLLGCIPKTAFVIRTCSSPAISTIFVPW